MYDDSAAVIAELIVDLMSNIEWYLFRKLCLAAIFCAVVEYGALANTIAKSVSNVMCLGIDCLKL